MLTANSKLALVLLGGILAGAATAEGLHAQQQAPQRTEVQKADLTGVPGTEVIMSIVEAAPGTVFPRHIHHGDEFSYVLQGGMV
jgi:quercetin dioxygenase-like cupin family protein